MKKLIFMMVAFCTLAMTANAQIMRAEELEKYARKNSAKNGWKPHKI